MITRRHLLQATAIVGLALCATPSYAQKVIELHGATQFNDDHTFNKTLLKFIELTGTYYKGQPIKFVMHPNSELGTERDYMNLMAQGISVDFAIIAPGNMSNFSRSAPILDMPFLFRDRAHSIKAVDGGAFAAVEQEVEKRASVKFLGYVGGSERNLVSKKPITKLEDLPSFKMRVQGAPIHGRIFKAIGVQPSVIAYNEVYNAIQSGVIDGLENEAAGIDQSKFYEVAPIIPLTGHSFTVRPFVFAKKTFDRLPKDLQAAITKAGAEAARYGRDLEIEVDKSLLSKMEKEGKLKTVEFKGREKLFEMVIPVQDEYAKEIGAEQILKAVRGM